MNDTKSLKTNPFEPNSTSQVQFNKTKVLLLFYSDEAVSEAKILKRIIAYN